MNQNLGSDPKTQQREDTSESAFVAFTELQVFMQTAANTESNNDPLCTEEFRILDIFDNKSVKYIQIRAANLKVCSLEIENSPVNLLFGNDH